jgi:hypothetical protein
VLLHLCPSGDEKLNSWRADCVSVASEYLGHLSLKYLMNMIFFFFFDALCSVCVPDADSVTGCNSHLPPRPPISFGRHSLAKLDKPTRPLHPWFTWVQLFFPDVVSPRRETRGVFFPLTCCADQLLVYCAELADAWAVSRVAI